MKHIVSLCMAVTGLSSLATASIGTPDTWSFISNTDAGRFQYVGSHEGGFTATIAGSYPYSFSDSNWFTVTGASTNDPNWDTVYANICNNTWSDGESGTTPYMAVGATLVYLRDYYTENGTETWQDNEDLSVYAARTLSSEVDTAAPYYFIYPPNTGTGGGTGPGGGA